MRRLRLASILAFIPAILVVTTPEAPLRAQPGAPPPSPAEFFGFPMGTEGRLAHWDDIVEYFRLVDERSDRVVVETLGPTTLGHPYLLATVAAPRTIATLPRHRARQRELADPRRTTPARADEIARTGKAVVLIGANVHATEIGTNQMMNDLVYRLATEDSPWVDHLLANTIVLLIPSQNPDGQRMIVDWYRRNRDTPYEGSPLPELYHPYAGHDNNRDSYMLTQVETRHLNRVLYEQWLPEVYLDQHQMGNTGPRIFVPPFRPPANRNVDPIVWNEVAQLGQAMAAALHAAGKPGVIWSELYSASWQGANNTNPWWHNMIGLLTETASAEIATPVRQTRAGAGAADEAPARPGSRRRPLAPPTDLRPRMNYPRPWRGGEWTLADVVEYQRLATTGLLESVANNRFTIKRNFYTMNRRAIERFRDGSPYAYVVPAAAHQRDPAAVVTLIQLLQAEAAEVHTARRPFVADGRDFPAGTYVVRLAQPFGRWVKDILEPQEYPGAEPPRSRADRPYDVTAWSLGLLMGVDAIRIDRPFDAALTRLATRAEAPRGRLIDTPSAGAGSFVVSHASNLALTAMNRWLDAGAAVEWIREPYQVTATDGRQYRLGRGAIHARGLDRATARAAARDLGLDIYATEVAGDVATLPIARPRLGVFEPWGGNMDAGWTRWVLDQHDFRYRRLRPADLRRPGLGERLDVIIIPQLTAATLLRGLQGPAIRPEYRGGIGRPGIRRLRAFVRAGGTVITLGNSAAIAAEHLGVPIRNRVRDLPADTFYGPGTIVTVELDPTHPIAYGLGPDAGAMFVHNGSWVARRGGAGQVTAVGRYPGGPMVESGWMIGESQLEGAGAVLDVRVGRGRVILHTFRVQHRGQTWGTFKLLLNSIFYGPAVGTGAAPPTTVGAP